MRAYLQTGVCLVVVASVVCLAGSASARVPTPVTRSTIVRPPTPTPTHPVEPQLPVCGGDCDEDGRVTVSELITAVNVALGSLDLPVCPMVDENGDRRVTVDELIGAVVHALAGCPDMARRAAAALSANVLALMAIPNAISVVKSGGVPGAGSGGATVIDREFGCPLGGRGRLRCEQRLFPPGIPEYAIEMVGCRVRGLTGNTLTFDGEARAAGGAACGTPAQELTLYLPEFRLLSETDGGSTATRFIGLSAVTFAEDRDRDCGYSTHQLQIDGEVEVVAANAAGVTLGGATAVLNDASLVVAVEQYGRDCLAAVYSVTAYGGLGLVTPSGALTGVYDAFTVRNDTREGTNRIDVSGAIESVCLGARVQFDTRAPLELNPGQFCPSGGTAVIRYPGGRDAIAYAADHGVAIDIGDDGRFDERFRSCLAPRLALCPAP